MGWCLSCAAAFLFGPNSVVNLSGKLTIVTRLPPYSIGLLSYPGKWISNCHTAEERNELAPAHSISSSARTSSDGGMASPRAFAVLAFTASSNLVG